MQVGKHRAFRHGEWLFIVQPINYTKPLRQHAVVGKIFSIQKLGNLDKRDGLLLVKFLVFLIFQTHMMPIVARFGKTAEHLEAHEIQVTEFVIVTFDTTRHRMLRGIEHKAVTISSIVYMLHLKDDAVHALIHRHDVRDNLLTEHAGHGRIHEGETLYTIATAEVEYRIQEVYGHPLVLRVAENQFEDGVVVDVDELILLSIPCNTGGDIATGLVSLIDVNKHCRILFFCHCGVLFAGTRPLRSRDLLPPVL